MRALQAPPDSNKRPLSGWPGRWGWAAIALTLLVVIVVRVRLLQVPLERDEGEYAYMGQLMLEGIPPYKLAYNMKLPGTYASYASIMAVFGQTAAGIHLGFLFANLAAVALLFLAARRLLDAEHAVVASICYALFSMSPGVLGLEGHATHFVVLAALAGLWLLLKARTSARLWTYGWSGAAFGWSFVCKQPGIFFCLFALAALLVDFIRAPREGKRKSFGNAAIFACGLALPFLLTCLLMAMTGVFGRFWFWTMTYAKAHAGLLARDEGWANLQAFVRNSGVMRWSWAAAAIGLLCLALDRARREAGAIIGALLIFSLVAFTASFYFSRHYFIMALPAVCLLIAAAVRRAARSMGEAVPAAGFALLCAGFIFANRSLWFAQSPEQVCRAQYGGNPFPEAKVIAKYIEEHSKPSDTIAIMGSEPEIYFYAHRHSATGYIYMYDLMQKHRFALDMQQEMERQIEAANPAYLLIVYVDSSWTFSAGSNKKALMDWLGRYWGQHYEMAGMAWMMPDRTEYVWSKDAASRNYDTNLRVAILHRK
ncbi:MAG TPA: glycosyltransferase family 39 protein [Verrucomicrobiae bacterium]|jgi:hypothetical protein